MELDAGIRNFLFLSRAIRQNSGNLAKVTTLDVLGAFLNYFFAFLSNCRFLALLRNEESGKHLNFCALIILETFWQPFQILSARTSLHRR